MGVGHSGFPLANLRLSVTKFLSIFVGFFFFFSATNNYAQWVVQQLPTTQRLGDVYFADSSNGWVVGDSAVYHTTNGGVDWNLQLVKAPHRGSIAGISADECWLLGSKDTLFHTTDQGIQWTQVAIGQNYDIDSILTLLKVFFVDSSNGWAVVYGTKNSQYASRLARTTDGGGSWHNSSFRSSDMTPLLQFFNPELGWVGGDGSCPSRTSDGGTTWDSLPCVGYLLNDDMQFVTEKQGWISSAGPVGSSELYKTIDSGSSWSIVLSFQCAGIVYLRFSDTLNGWVIVPTCINGDHTDIWHTSDGGSNWDIQMSYYAAFYYHARRAFFIDKFHGWIVGEHGIVFHTSNGGVTDAQEGITMSQNEYALQQNAPNPFNPSTSITFVSQARSFVRIEIYDVLGRRVKLLVDGTFGAGPHQVLWDGQRDDGVNVDSGIYFYRMTATRRDSKIYTESKKMILVR